MAPGSMKKADILVALILVPMCSYVFYESTKWPKEALIGVPTLIPRGVAACLLFAAGMLFVRAVTGRALLLEDRLGGRESATGHLRRFADRSVCLHRVLGRLPDYHFFLPLAFWLGRGRAALAPFNPFFSHGTGRRLLDLCNYLERTLAARIFQVALYLRN